MNTQVELDVLPVSAEQDDPWYAVALSEGYVNTGNELVKVEGVDPLSGCILIARPTS